MCESGLGDRLGGGWLTRRAGSLKSRIHTQGAGGLEGDVSGTLWREGSRYMATVKDRETERGRSGPERAQQGQYPHTAPFFYLPSEGPLTHRKRARRLQVLLTMVSLAEHHPTSVSRSTLVQVTQFPGGQTHLPVAWAQSGQPPLSS